MVMLNPFYDSGQVPVVDVANPGFEQGADGDSPPPGWTGTGTTMYAGTSQAHSGAMVCRLNRAYIEQAVKVVPRRAYSFSAYLLELNDPDILEAEMIVLDADGGRIATLSCDPTNRWARYAVGFTAPDSGMVVIRVDVAEGSYQTNIWVDDVSVDPGGRA